MQRKRIRIGGFSEGKNTVHKHKQNFKIMKNISKKANHLFLYSVSKCCDICSNEDVRTAVTMNETKVCHKCLNYIEKQSELNGTDKMEELNHQTKYVASNFC